ncbi:MAG: citramalate synthase [Bryobacteraceae bacterium]|nr:citramalate synthase [Bryobacteraceae bacterium]
MRIWTFDTTLRDGTQGATISFSVEDKLTIAQKLDELGIDYIEGGWPMSNPKDKEFFARARDVKFKHAKLTAFGATRFAKNPVEKDSNTLALLEAGTPAISIFGKTWDMHVTRVLGITLEQNLELISDSVAFLKSHGREVIYDAEHFFDGYIANPDYALKTLEAAAKSGADVLCLCDTNGGTITGKVAEIVAEIRKRFDGTIGIHTHNDSDLAVANSIAAIEQGATHVQGCMNGYGERCGNANLSSVIAILEAKLGHTTVGPEKLKSLTAVSHFIAELANLPLPQNQPFVGRAAFAHKGGVHVAAVMKTAASYEHMDPGVLGNRQQVLLSDLSGRGNVVYKLKEHGLEDKLDDAARRDLLDRIKHLEYEGYELEAAEGTFELLVRDALNPGKKFFEVISYETQSRKIDGRDSATSATVILRAGDEIHSAHATGDGPVNALDVCLRQCLSNVYPQIRDVRLTDYKVRVIDSGKGTAAKVRVLVEWSDHKRSWTTVGVSTNIIEASWKALVDAISLELMRLSDADDRIEKAVGGFCIGVENN